MVEGPPETHSTAIVHAGARLGRGVSVGPYCVIGEHVEIGDGTRVGPHAVIEGWTRIGKLNQIGVGAVIGAPPQDRKYTGARTFVRIGDRNIIREYVTIHRASDLEGATVIGDDNFIMGFAHIAHNCTVGSHTTITNLVGLSGHIVVEDHVLLGGMTAFHQFVRIGMYAIVGGGLRVRMDVVPFAMAGGEPLRVYGLNREGLKRNGFTAERQRLLKGAYRILFWSGLTTTDAVVRLKSELGQHEDVARLIKFVEDSHRGLTQGLRVATGEDLGEQDGEESPSPPGGGRSSAG